ncbi:hypothetical protein Tco_0824377 [Tanacetum coccineum]|uniref:Reverse transcriptase domain-containing protein n=1 Tax=Tanacetum coccineum TaxID=301880 RepID=A0ABQ5APL6_9ASTR
MQGVSNTDFENYVKANDVLSTLPSQTVTNPREHVNAITTRSGKTCEGPSTPLVPTSVVSTPQKEPEQDPKTSMDKVQKSESLPPFIYKQLGLGALKPTRMTLELANRSVNSAQWHKPRML